MLADKGYFQVNELDTAAATRSMANPETGKVLGAQASHGSPKRRVFVVPGDGEIDEGSVWEAALSAQAQAVEPDCNPRLR